MALPSVFLAELLVKDELDDVVTLDELEEVDSVELLDVSVDVWLLMLQAVKNNELAAAKAK